MSTIFPIEVRIDDLSGREVGALIAEHIAGMHRHTPPEQVFALALEGLRQPEVTFWSAWREDVLCGCGALQALDQVSGEVKSMRTREPFLRQGVALAVLGEILRTALSRGYSDLFLETGTSQAFEAAHALYLRNGFQWCGPFGEYEASGSNVFMRKRLTQA